MMRHGRSASCSAGPARRVAYWTSRRAFRRAPRKRGRAARRQCARLKTGVSVVHPVSLFAELKRRRVIRALVGYGIVAFAVLQIIEPVIHGLHWPDEVLSYVVVALAAGFPVIVTLAWIFDVRSGRIDRTT